VRNITAPPPTRAPRSGNVNENSRGCRLLLNEEERKDNTLKSRERRQGKPSVLAPKKENGKRTGGRQGKEDPAREKVGRKKYPYSEKSSTIADQVLDL